jgi:hypothetical protein
MQACRAGPSAAALSNQSTELLFLDHSLFCVYSNELSKRTGMIQEYTPSNHRCQGLAGVFLSDLRIPTIERSPGVVQGYLRLPGLKARGFLLSFQLFTLVRKGTSLETNKTCEPTHSGVEDIRASGQPTRLSCVPTLASDYTPISGRCSSGSEAREERGVPCPGAGALRSHGFLLEQVYYKGVEMSSVLAFQAGSPPTGGRLFILR